MNSSKSALFRLHLIVFLWGFTAILGKIIHAPAPALVFFRMLFASGFLWIYIVFIRKETLRPPRKLLLQLLGIGAVMGMHWLCFFYSIKVSNVSIALSCLSLSTLFASLLEPFIFKRKIDAAEVIIGLIIVVCIGLIFNAEMSYKLGIIAGVVCALFGTIFSVLNGKLFGRTTVGNIIFYEIFGGWLFVALLFTIMGQGSAFTDVSWRDIGLILLLSSLFTAFPMFESVSLMKFISPFTLILTVNLEPVYGIILAYFIFGESEHMSPVFYVASLVMILAIVANGIIKSRRAIAAENLK